MSRRSARSLSTLVAMDQPTTRAAALLAVLLAACAAPALTQAPQPPAGPAPDPASLPLLPGPAQRVVASGTREVVEGGAAAALLVPPDYAWTLQPGG